MKNNPEMLSRWLQELVAGEMYREVGTYWYDALLGGEEAFEDILAPVIATMPVEDQEFFRDTAQAGYFEEDTKMFRQSFSVKASPPSLIEMIE